MNIEETGGQLSRPAPAPGQPAPFAENAAWPSVSLRLSLLLPREPASVGQGRRLFGTALAVLGVAAGCRAEIMLMLTEASTNAVVHAAGEMYQVNMTVDPRRCVVEVLDRGAGLSDTRWGWASGDVGPVDASLEQGRGMFLIRILSDAAEWIPVRPHGLTVRMSKWLVWDATGRTRR